MKKKKKTCLSRYIAMHGQPLVSYLEPNKNMEHMRESKPDSGLGFQVKSLNLPRCSNFTPKRLAVHGQTVSGFGCMTFKNNHFTEMCSGCKAGS